MTTQKSTLPLDRARIRALLFDVDGTLSNSDDHMVNRFANKLRFLDSTFKPGIAHRLARSFVHFAETPGNWLLQMADRLNLDPHLASFLDRRANGKEAELHNFPAIASILPMLQILSGRFPLAIVSARNEVTTRHFLRLNQLEEYFPVVVTSQTCARTKPFPDPLLYAAEQLGVPIENCLMIGDTVTDVRAAKAASAQSLSVLCGFGLEKELRRAGTQEILASTSELATYLTSTPLSGNRI
jgi:phosphoglycolate phosphatase-like HAD superfamily hydrolase